MFFCFVNCQQGASLRISLEEMGHQQPPIPLVTASATRNGFVNYKIRRQKSKAIDMILYWVRNRVRQGHYLVYWERKKDNLADYFTKPHPTEHRHATRGTYLVPTYDPSKHAYYQLPIDLQGCVKSPPAQETGKGWTRYSLPINIQSPDRDIHATRFRRQIRKYLKPCGNIYANDDVCLRTIPLRLLATREVLVASTVAR